MSKVGSNADGRSWSAAWNELDQIDWSSIQPGDTILLDGGGGSSQMVYSTPLIVGASGSSSAPITIKLAPDAGRNGQAVIFGGRSTPLPYCDQPSYNYQNSGVNNIGIELGSARWVVVDGTKWSGILVKGNNQYGIHLDSGSSNVTVRNTEITENGMAFLHNGAWRPDLPGVALSGANNLFDRTLVHDNGQDAFQSNGGISNFTLRQSWLYNSRPHPSNPSLAYNYCMHSDGIQVYNGGVQSGVTIQSTILGPGLMQGTILGQALSGGQSAQIDDVTFSDVLILDTTNANIMGYPTIQSRNWLIQNVTSFHVLYDPDGSSHSATFLEGSGHVIRDSIMYGGNNYLPDGAQTGGNYQYNLTGYTIGQTADPLFVNAPAYTSQPTLQDLINGDYAPRAGSPVQGKGSAITSVSTLLGAAPPPPPPPATPPASTPTQPAGSTPTNTPQPPAPTNTPRTPVPTRTQGSGTATAEATHTHVPPGQSPTSNPAQTSTPESTIAPTITTVPNPCNTGFPDVPAGSTFYSSIKCLVCNDIVSGYPDGTFRPGNFLTRGQLSKIVSNAAGLTGAPTGQRFQDITAGSTFYNFVDRLAARDFISGYPCGGPGEQCVAPGNLPYFRPNGISSRGQIAKVVANAAGLTGAPNAPRFHDVPANSPFYVYIDRLAAQGTISGYTCGSASEPCVAPHNLPYFRPSDSSTRGQLSKIVSNTFFPDWTP
ncbi:MAG: S-layer homology domain-containing protein [Chloroflexota bacterium]